MCVNIPLKYVFEKNYKMYTHTHKKVWQSTVSYHGLHIESEVTGGATGDD